jgi:hypothetical protein
LQLILSVTPGEVRNAARFTRNLAHVAYCIGPSSTLLRQDLLLDTRGGWLSVSDREAPPVAAPDQLAAAVLRECGRRGYAGAVLDFEAPPTGDRQEFARTLCRQLTASRRTLLVPEAYAVPGAVTLVNTAVSGGSFSQCLEEARAKYGRIALDLQRLAMDFPLPAPTGQGTPLSIAQLQRQLEELAPVVFFSPELCARYFTCQKNGETHFVLFDDADTLLRKVRLGSAMGIATGLFMYPEVEDLLPRLFPGRSG